MFIKLTNQFDNPVIIAVSRIVSFEICNIDDFALGLEITLDNGNKIKVKECIRDMRKVIDIKEPNETNF